MPVLQTYRGILVALLLTAATLTVYHGVAAFDFINLDDNIYIYENRHVQGGLSRDSVTWAFSNNTAGMWIPLTWLSYLLDITLHGVDPGAMHLTNVGLHLLNVLILCALLCSLTGTFWTSAFVAGCFALHPMHVESVAWITERKDVLSTLGFLLTLWQYGRFARHPTAGRYLVALMLYIFTLMAKPMYVTLPFLMLLLDYWPLQRYSAESLRQSGIRLKGTAVRYLVVEKLPFFFLTVVGTALTYWSFQQTVAWMHPIDIPLDVRLTTAATAYLKYIGKLFWPANLAVLYPYHPLADWPQMLTALGLLAAISAGVVWRMRQSPFLFVGWFWFLGLLVPVIGLVNAGSHAMADRFSYGSFIGLYIMLAWGVTQVLSGWQRRHWLLLPLVLILAIGMMTASHRQVQYWADSVTLYTQSLKNTRDNWFLHNSLGNALGRQGQTEAAIAQFRKALLLKPDYAAAHNNLGVSLGRVGQTQAAVARFQEAVRISPTYADAHYNLGVALSAQGRLEDALGHYLEAIRIRPEHGRAHNNAGGILLHIGHLQEARKHYAAALRIDPRDEKARLNLEGVAERLAAQGTQ